MRHPLRVISLFSGCGGMDLGFMGGFQFGGRHYARLPFEIVWANDINRHACAAYRLNHPLGIHEGDVVDAMATLPPRADVVIGGFPCQDVSINGLQRMANGVRTVLYKHMVDVIRRTQPAAFVAENVRGLLFPTARPFFDAMLADFGLPGYTVSHKLYRASDYGVPQARFRVFIVGVRGQRAFRHPEPLDGPPMTACEALHDLEHAPVCKATAHVWSKAKASPEQGSRKLRADAPATTIRAEHHGNTQWHYSQDRRISLREAARLQSFPDAFRFPCGMRESERQIGNAVPPVLAWRIAQAVHAHIAGG